MQEDSKILILGARGLVGSAITAELQRLNYKNLLTPNREELNLLVQKDVQDYFSNHKPKYVFFAAAKVGGIVANNTYRADFIFENLSIQNNVFQGAFESKVERLLFIGSSCIYPKNCSQPIKEEYLLTGPLEPTNEPYAIAKIAGLKLAESFRRQYGSQYYSVMPTNLFGENDNFHEENSHVIPGLIARMKQAMDNRDQAFEVWGTGKPKREFLYVDDLANACVFIMKQAQDIPDIINIGAGKDISIENLAHLIANELGYKGQIVFNDSIPDGTMRKLLDITHITKLGWKPNYTLKQGIEKVVKHYLSCENTVRKK